MKWSLFFNQPLGTMCTTGHSTKKEMPVPLAIPLVMGAASLASSIFGGVKSSAAAREQQRQLEEEKRRVQAERLRKTNEDYIDTAAGQNLLRVARQERDKMWKRESGAAAVAGGTEAAAAMAKEAGNRMVGDTIANIAAQDTSRKDSIDASYRSELSNLNQQKMAAKRAEAEAIAGAAGQASSALMQGAISTFGNTKLGQSWFGSGTQAAPEGTAGGGGMQTKVSAGPDLGATQATQDTTATPVKPITPNYGPAMNNLFQTNKNYGLMQKSRLYNPNLFWGR